MGEVIVALELLQLKEPDETPIEVFYDENEPKPPKKNKQKLYQTSTTRFVVQT